MNRPPALVFERAPCPRCGATTEEDAGEKCQPSLDETGDAYCPGTDIDDAGYIVRPTEESLAAEAAWYDARMPDEKDFPE